MGQETELTILQDEKAVERRTLDELGLRRAAMIKLVGENVFAERNYDILKTSLEKVNGPERDRYLKSMFLYLTDVVSLYKKTSLAKQEQLVRYCFQRRLWGIQKALLIEVYHKAMDKFFDDKGQGFFSKIVPEGVKALRDKLKDIEVTSQDGLIDEIWNDCLKIVQNRLQIKTKRDPAVQKLYEECLDMLSPQKDQELLIKTHEATSI
jgi:hypothetical protein